MTLHTFLVNTHRYGRINTHFSPGRIMGGCLREMRGG